MFFIVVFMKFFNLVISIFNAINLSSIFAKINEFEEFDEATTNETTTDETTTDETTTNETTTDKMTTDEATTNEVEATTNEAN